MKKYIFFLLFFLLLLEVGLRSIGILNVYSERLGDKYRSYWGFEHKGHYKILPKNSTVEFQQKEFSVSYRTNSFGMRNPEITSVPKDSTIRILCLGDSFTQGDGATNGHSFPRELERILNLNNRHKHFEVINAGNNGSDLIYEEKLFVDAAYSFQPYLVIFVINDSDVEDIIQRGGLDRFKNDNTTKFKKGPRIESAYKRSHVVRLFTHLVLGRSFLLLSPNKEKEEIEKANIILEESMMRLIQFCESKDIYVRFVIHPIPGYAKSKKPLDKIPFKLNRENNFEKIESEGYMYNINESLLDTIKKIPF
ncbi:MAG: SGNH/GDSL hydrolase family protein, partial [Bacteroidetes bacterium]|nr:SGNH/GDSL hydrolase family protein [Bacteroidota bacterium]